MQLIWTFKPWKSKLSQKFQTVHLCSSLSASERRPAKFNVTLAFRPNPFECVCVPLSMVDKRDADPFNASAGALADHYDMNFTAAAKVGHLKERRSAVYD